MTRSFGRKFDKKYNYDTIHTEVISHQSKKEENRDEST